MRTRPAAACSFPGFCSRGAGGQWAEYGGVKCTACGLHLPGTHSPLAPNVCSPGEEVSVSGINIFFVLEVWLGWEPETEALDSDLRMLMLPSLLGARW